MKTKSNQKITFLIGITLIGLLVSFTTIGTKNKNQNKNPDLMLCVGYYWTEAEGKAELVENAHFPTEKHGFDYSKRAAVYPFLAKYLGLDLSKAMNPDGSLKEEGIVIED